jgi:hypothetical protein
MHWFERVRKRPEEAVAFRRDAVAALDAASPEAAARAVKRLVEGASVEAVGAFLEDVGAAREAFESDVGLAVGGDDAVDEGMLEGRTAMVADALNLCVTVDGARVRVADLERSPGLVWRVWTVNHRGEGFTRGAGR